MKEKIIRYADSLAWRWRTFPPSLHIALTDYCFNRCKVCGHWQRQNKQTLDWQHLSSLLKLGAGQGLETVCLTGGDPLHYQKINELMALCCELGVDYGLVTAGYVPQHINLELVAQARWVRCSVDAVGEAAYANVRGGARWASIVRGLERMGSVGANLQVFVTISRFNVEALADLFTWLWEQRYMFSEVRARPVYKHVGEELMLDHKESIRDFLVDWAVKFADEGIRTDLTVDQFDPQVFERCVAVKYQWFIGASGNIYPCCITAGDTERKSRVKPFGNIYNAPQWPSVRPGLGWKGCLIKIEEWSRVTGDKLPRVCREECAPRFNAINTVLSHDRLSEKNFF